MPSRSSGNFCPLPWVPWPKSRRLIISKEINYLADDELIPLIGDLDIIRKMVKALANCLN
jgi:hypothetical protein